MSERSPPKAPPALFSAGVGGEGSLEQRLRNIARVPWGRFIEKRLRPGEAYGWHRHDTAAVTLTLSGEYAEEFESSIQQVPRGELQFKPSGIAHTTTAGPMGARILLVAFADADPAAADPYLVESGLASAYMVAAARAASVGGSDFARERVRRILRPAEAPRCDASPCWIDEVAARIDASPHETRSLEALATPHDVHPVHLARAFRKRFGQSVGEYRARCRVARATDRLIAGNEPVVDIAFALGFSDQSHFTRTFGAVTGTTPARFRRSLR